MPMNFPDMRSLEITAEVHQFRQPEKNEAEADFRKALAEHVISRDRIEAFEILFGVGWDQWNDEQKMQSLTGRI